MIRTRHSPAIIYARVTFAPFVFFFLKIPINTKICILIFFYKRRKVWALEPVAAHGHMNGRGPQDGVAAGGTENRRFGGFSEVILSGASDVFIKNS
jgi:hypothetical protein